MRISIDANVIEFMRPIGEGLYRWGGEREYNVAHVIDVDTSANDSDDDPWFIFYVEDCAFPTLHAIQARSFEAAYECFCEQEAERGHYIVAEDDPDYTDEQREDLWQTSKGPLVTESFRGFEVVIVSAEVRK